MRFLAFGGGARGGAGPFFSCCSLFIALLFLSCFSPRRERLAAGADCELPLAAGRGAGPFFSTVRGISPWYSR